MDTDADNTPTPIPTETDQSDTTIQQNDTSVSANHGAKKNGKVQQKDPYRWAGFFKDDPSWDAVMASIKAEHAELDAAQE